MYKDSITEMQFGDGAIKVAGRLMFQNHDKVGVLNRTLVLGTFLSLDSVFIKDIKGA